MHRGKHDASSSWLVRVGKPIDLGLEPGEPLAHGAGTAALGLSEVVGALNQARVAHLVYDPFIRYRGSVGYDGSLYAEDETALTYGSTADERLTERIVERAFETGARVTPVEGAANDGLADAVGIAAVLRW